MRKQVFPLDSLLDIWLPSPLEDDFNKPKKEHNIDHTSKQKENSGIGVTNHSINILVVLIHLSIFNIKYV